MCVPEALKAHPQSHCSTRGHRRLPRSPGTRGMTPRWLRPEDMNMDKDGHGRVTAEDAKRILVPRDWDNLWVAGRCHSSVHRHTLASLL